MLLYTASFEYKIRIIEDSVNHPYHSAGVYEGGVHINKNWDGHWNDQKISNSYGFVCSYIIKSK